DGEAIGVRFPLAPTPRSTVLVRALADRRFDLARRVVEGGRGPEPLVRGTEPDEPREVGLEPAHDLVRAERDHHLRARRALAQPREPRLDRDHLGPRHREILHSSARKTSATASPLSIIARWNRM